MNYMFKSSINPNEWESPEIAPSVLSADFGYLMRDV